MSSSNLGRSNINAYTIGATAYNNGMTLELVDVLMDMDSQPCTIVFNEIITASNKREHTAALKHTTGGFMFKYCGSTFYLRDFN